MTASAQLASRIVAPTGQEATQTIIKISKFAKKAGVNQNHDAICDAKLLAETIFHPHTPPWERGNGLSGLKSIISRGGGAIKDEYFDEWLQIVKEIELTGLKMGYIGSDALSPYEHLMMGSTTTDAEKMAQPLVPFALHEGKKTQDELNLARMLQATAKVGGGLYGLAKTCSIVLEPLGADGRIAWPPKVVGMDKMKIAWDAITRSVSGAEAALRKWVETFEEIVGACVIATEKNPTLDEMATRNRRA